MIKQKPKQTQMPQASEKEASLISSDILPEFEDLDKEYQEQMAEIAREEEAEKLKADKKKRKDVIAPVQSEEINISVDAEAIADIVAFPLDMYFVRNDKDKLSDIEKEALSKAVAKVANKYFPTIANKYGEEIALAVCLGTIFAVRIELPEIKKPEEKPIIKEDVVFRNKTGDVNSFGVQKGE